MYEAEPDPYCYPGTTVLINRLGIRDQSALDIFETEVTSERATQALPSAGLTYSDYCALHRHLFQDVYAWAGEIRTVRISKEGSAFCYPEHVDRQMRTLFAGLAKEANYRALDTDTFAKKAAHFLAELNAIHPFREGNGRTQLTFLTILAEQAGHPLALERLDPEEILKATVASFTGEEAALSSLIRDFIA